MSQLPKTDVPWADRQWPIIRGCSAASTGCLNCYAHTWFRRFGKRLGWEWGKPIFFPKNLDMPAKTKKPCRVFVAPMSDVWHGSVEATTRRDIEYRMDAAPWHIYILLTKRPENIPLNSILPDNWWVGVSAENQEQYDKRWNELCRRVKAKVRFVSIEPCLENIALCPAPDVFPQYPDWVVMGPETGARARVPFSLSCWMRDKSEWCETTQPRVPFYDKRTPFLRREFPV